MSLVQSYSSRPPTLQNASPPFLTKIVNSIEKNGNIVLGIDPDLNRIPNCFNQSHRIEATLELYCRELLTAAAENVAAVKFQSACFEQYGLLGMVALSNSLSYARQLNYIIILDAKRGDIAETNQCYAQAYLDDSNKADSFLVDAITVSPWLGIDALQPFINSAKQYGKGLFLVLRSSNPGSDSVQNFTGHNLKLSEYIINCFLEFFGNESALSQVIGFVVGATLPDESEQLRRYLPESVFLVPGMGAQGGLCNRKQAFWGKFSSRTLFPLSRSLTLMNKDVSRNEFNHVIAKRLSDYREQLAEVRL
ncbi:orotidine-5'-phosphate decarboxylase [Zooshikella ganghwensis]|uniref:Orotidine-5'-phosphate decarboxylase n=1 Tax=Zooshikella ganghwensis TaxID=202772 RepID=A0A4P9VKS9_9GAMM|nr:orotidine-5'-phosphate decarboxylase [Zooshikella ganghwensis]